MKPTLAAWVRTIAASLSAGVRSALLIGAWLALTILFLFVGVVLVGTVVTSLVSSQGPVSFLIVLVGVLGACGVSPTLAHATIIAAVERFDAVLGRNPESDGGLFGPCDLKGRANCRSSRECCC